MIRPSLLVGALAVTMFAAGDVRAMPSNDSGQTPGTAAGASMLLAQGGGGGDGDSAGRGPDTSKGAVPKDQGYPSGQYPSGITSPGTAPAPGAPAAGSSAAPTTSPGTEAGGAPGTGLRIPRNHSERRYDADGPVTARTSFATPAPCRASSGGRPIVNNDAEGVLNAQGISRLPQNAANV